MRKLLYTISVCLFVTALQSQDYKEGDIIELTKYVKTKTTPSALQTGVDLETNNVNFLGTFKYRIVQVDNGTNEVKLIALDFEDSDAGTLDEQYNGKIYTVDKADFNASFKEVKPFNRLNIGLVTLPYKARFKKGGLFRFHSFDTEFSLNSTLNFKPFKKAESLSILIGSGIGSVGLNTSNSAGLQDEEAVDASTLSFLYGVMYEKNSIQVGLYFGKDWINNQDQYQWNGHNKPWAALGIGYGIFKIANAETKQ